MSSNHLTRESILGSADLPTDTLEVPRWGGTIVVKAVPTSHPRYVQYWSGQAELAKGHKITEDEKQVRRLVGACILAAHAYEGDDEDGNPVAGPRLFKFADANELREKHYNSVIQVANQGFALAGNTADEERGLTINAIVRVGNYAQAHDWPTEQQDQIAALLEYLVVEEVGLEVAAGDDDPVAAEIVDEDDLPDDPDDEDDLPEADTSEADPDDDEVEAGPLGEARPED